MRRMITLAGLGLLAMGSRVQAKDVFVGSLEPSATGGIHASTEQKLTLTDEKPTTVAREGAYAYKAQYGTITLGNGKNNKIAIALDTDGTTSRPRLFIDANGTGDLTTAVALTPVRSTASTGSTGKPTYTASVSVTAHYDVPGRGGSVPSTLSFTLRGSELTYNREYARVGKVTIGTRTFTVALVDEAVNGRFNEFQHEDGEPARVTLYIDRLGKGKFDSTKDRFDAAKPFRLAGATYEIATIDPRGTAFALKSSSKSAGISAASLKAGSDVIEFEAETVDGKRVRFPDDFHGKVVLLDFWAMWCGPCMAEMPNVISVYNQYHPKGFEILGVSLDQANKKTALIRFLAQNNMPWSQIYDGGYWKAEIAQLYQIEAIPHALLVDGTTGRIVALGNDIRGAALAPAVEAALAAKGH